MLGKTTSNYVSPTTNAEPSNVSAYTQQSNLPSQTSDRMATNQMMNQPGRRKESFLHRALGMSGWMSSKTVNRFYQFFLDDVMNTIEKHYPQASNAPTHPRPSYEQETSEAPPPYSRHPTNPPSSAAGTPLQHEAAHSAVHQADGSTRFQEVIQSCVDRIYADTAKRCQTAFGQPLPQSNTHWQPSSGKSGELQAPETDVLRKTENSLRDYLDAKVAEGRGVMQTLLDEIKTLETEHAHLKSEHEKLPHDPPDAREKKMQEMEEKQQQIDKKLGEIHRQQTRQSVLEGLLRMQQQGELEELRAALEAEAQWSKRANNSSLRMI